MCQWIETTITDKDGNETTIQTVMRCSDPECINNK